MMLISQSYNNTQNTSNDITLPMNHLQQQSPQKLQSHVKRMSSTSSTTSLSQKDIPMALTVNGTTPSGKPRLYVCNTCTRAFARQEHLKRHERSHTQEKPFVCGVCERLFSRRDLLLRHAQKLHAGCADAITRIRKKSSRRRKSSTVSSTSMSRKSSSVSSITIKEEEEYTGGMENNPFGNMKIEVLKMQGNYPDIPSNIMTNPTSSVSPPTPIYLEKKLNSQEQDQFHDSNIKRRASFSAVSSANYAMPIPNTSYAENVEFSTPSLNAQQPSWLNGFELDSIPELSLFNPNPNPLANRGGGGGAVNNFNNQDHESPFGTTSRDQQDDEIKKPLPNISGYSFYDNEQAPIVESLFNNHHVFKALLLLLLLLNNRKNSNDGNEDIYSPDDDNHSFRRASSSVMSLENNVDRNLNEIEEITDLNIPKMYDMPAGYSFYGNVDQQSNSASSNATISPSLLDPTLLNNNNKSNMSTPPQRVVIQTANTFASMLKLEKYSRILLFSPILRSHINHTLNNYPFVGVKVPNLPSNDKLNMYTENFIDRFLSHYPFVHKSMLNEYALMKTTLDDINKNETSNSMNQVELDNLRASIACLPLLVATIGALLSNEKEDANSLYEVSRRCIHVYLDSRKKKSSEQLHFHHRTSPSSAPGTNNSNASPLWLIQSLTLSVIYGLFADNEVSINVVIRQVNALTALVKSSEMTKIKWDYASISSGERVIDEDYFFDFIKYESAVRTIHSIFHVVVTLTSLYNIAPSLKIDDLELDLPNSSILWNSSNYGEFKSFYNGFAFQPEKYKKCLNDLISLDINSKTNELSHSGGFFFSHHVSDFGLICLQNGLHQLFYYDKLYGNLGATGKGISRQNSYTSSTLSSPSAKVKRGVDSLKENYLNISKIWNLMVGQCKLYLDSNDLVIDSKLMNYHLLMKNSAFKVKTVFNLKLHKLKEQVWLKDWDKMCDIFKGVEGIDNGKLGEDDQLEIFKMVSYCLLIVREFFYRDVKLEQKDVVDVEQFFKNYDGNLANEVDSFIKNLDSSQCDLEHLMKVSSLQFQILFDVFLILIKFVLNFNDAKVPGTDPDLHSSFSFKNSPENEDGMDIDSPMDHHNQDRGSLQRRRYLKSYISTIQLIVNLQHFQPDSAKFNQLNDAYKQNVNNLMLLSDGIRSNRKDSSNHKKNVNNDNDNDEEDDEDDDDLMDQDEIFTGLSESYPSESSIDYLIPKEKILNKFFKTIDFIFDYLIFNKLKFKFGCFKNLDCGLIKLNFFLFNDELITNDGNNINDNHNNNNNMFDVLH